MKCEHAVICESEIVHPPGASSAEACAECAREHGCEACFEELVRRFQSPLLHFLIRRVGLRHDAEDLLQETFFLAHRNLDRYQATWKFSTWLFTIASRLAASSRRRGSKIGGAQLAEAQAAARAGASDPHLKSAQNEERSQLWDKAQEILSADAFTALWLSYVESMPADQIGQVLGRNANAVRILLHRARVRLGEHL